jgi:hypothetical protein
MRSSSRVSKVLVLLSLAIVAMGAALAAGASAKTFQTEDGNIRCFMRAKFVRCDISKHKWQSPPKPKSCEFDWGSSLGLDKKGRASFLCVSDAFEVRNTVGAGETVAVGPYRCRVRKNSKVFCLYGNSGGFKLSKKHYELF